MHWAISYLREDIQDLRAEMRAMREEMRHDRDSVRRDVHRLDQRIDGVHDSLTRRIDSRFALFRMHLPLP